MAWTTPITWVAGQVVTAAELNQQVSDNLNFLYAVPRVSVYQTAATTMGTSNVAALLLFDTESWDTDTMHSTVSNTSRLTATTAGMYHVNFTVGFAANNVGVRTVQARLNAAGSSVGGTSLLVGRVAAGATSPTVVSASFDTSLAAGDYIELFGTQTSGGSLATQPGSDSTVFQMRWVAAS